MTSETSKSDKGEFITFTPHSMANGGKAVGRDQGNRTIFVPLAIPGETIRVQISESRARFAQGNIIEIITPSPDRVAPRCPHFGSCGVCHFQHIAYEAQLRYKRLVVQDQLKRIGKLENVLVREVIPSPEPWNYSLEALFHTTPAGQLGYWFTSTNGVTIIQECHIIKSELLEAYQQTDLELPSLNSLALRLGEEGDLLAALVIMDEETPSLATDLPLSANVILPDGTTLNLIGDNHTVHDVKGRTFRFVASSYIYPSLAATQQLIDTVLEKANLTEGERVVELYCGSGLLTAFIASLVRIVEGIEANSDAIGDLAANLDHLDNVVIYQGEAGEILPGLQKSPDLLVLSPPSEGLEPHELDLIAYLEPFRIIYISRDVATLARDAHRFAQKGFSLLEVQPIDMWPQTYHTLTVSSMKAKRTVS